MPGILELVSGDDVGHRRDRLDGPGGLILRSRLAHLVDPSPALLEPIVHGIRGGTRGRREEHRGRVGALAALAKVVLDRVHHPVEFLGLLERATRPRERGEGDVCEVIGARLPSGLALLRGVERSADHGVEDVHRGGLGDDADDGPHRDKTEQKASPDPVVEGCGRERRLEQLASSADHLLDELAAAVVEHRHEGGVHRGFDRQVLHALKHELARGLVERGEILRQKPAEVLHHLGRAVAVDDGLAHLLELAAASHRAGTANCGFEHPHVGAILSSGRRGGSGNRLSALDRRRTGALNLRSAANRRSRVRDGEERGNPASGGGIPARDTPHDGGACRL